MRLATWVLYGRKALRLYGQKALSSTPLLRRRRCFENAKPRRSAGGAQLNRFLGESEGPIRDPVLARFARVAAFSSAESGSGEPPDRAQICAMMMVLLSDPVFQTFFFLSRFWDRKNGLLVVKTRKSESKKWIAPVMWPRTVPNLGPEPSLVKKVDHRHWNPN